MHILLKNYPQKILAILLAIFIWMIASKPQDIGNTEIQFFIPVSYANLSSDFEIVSKPLQATNVTIQTTSNNQKDIHPSLFQAVVDLNGMEPGENIYRITKDDIKTPDNVKIVKIFPDIIELSIEKMIEMELPIRPILQGETAKGYVLEQVKTVPEKIRIKAPSSMTEGLRQIETRAINIEGLNSDIDMLVHLILPEKVRIIDDKETPNFYSVKIQIGSEPMNLRFDAIPIGLVNQTYVTRINPKTFNILVKGPKTLLENFSKKDIQAFIDLGRYKPGTYKIKSPQIYLPPAIQVLEVWPPIDIWVLKQKVYE